MTAALTGLTVESVRASHGATEVLHGVDLHVPEHSLACIVGPSGCGKTTLLRCIAGFHRPTAGRIGLGDRVLDDAPAKHLAADRRRIGYIPQDIALFPHLSVAANVGFGLPRGRRAAGARVRELLDLVDLADYAERHPHQLSGGQQQRIALARALAPEPELLLLDEPFSALDAGLRARVRTDVVDLLRRTSTTAILVTHDAQEALAFADMISIVNAGLITQTGAPAELYDRPVNSRVARALGEANLLQATALKGQAMTALGPLTTTVSMNGTPDYLVLVRPRDLVVSGEPMAKGAAPLIKGVSGRVVRSTFHGDDHRLEVRVEGVDEPLIAHSPRELAAGSVVTLTVPGPVHPVLD